MWQGRNPVQHTAPVPAKPFTLPVLPRECSTAPWPGVRMAGLIGDTQEMNDGLEADRPHAVAARAPGAWWLKDHRQGSGCGRSSEVCGAWCVNSNPTRRG